MGSKPTEHLKPTRFPVEIQVKKSGYFAYETCDETEKILIKEQNHCDCSDCFLFRADVTIYSKKYCKVHQGK
jgi:hypothetical protein